MIPSSPHGTSLDTVERPVNPATFILGAPRSGTSMLYKLLCLHREAAWISNWNRLVPGVLAVSALTRIPRRFPQRRRLAWFGADSNAYVYGKRRSVADRLFPMPVEGEPLFVRCGLALEIEAAEDVSPSAVLALRQTFGAVHRFSNGKTMISKRIGNNHRILALLQAFPDARFVHLVRDGRAVASSLRKVDWWDDSVVNWYGGTPRTWEQCGGDPWEIAARVWVEEILAVERGLLAVPSSQVLTLKYENFIADPHAGLAMIAEFVGLAVSPAWEAEVAALANPRQAGPDRGGLSPEVLAEVDKWQGPTLERYGYEV